MRIADQESEQRLERLQNKGLPQSDALNVNGGIAGSIAALLQDVEQGDRSGVTLRDLGLENIAGMAQADHYLQLLSALMAVRADARLVIFSLWVLCHMIYLLYLVYEHFIRRGFAASRRIIHKLLV